MPHIYVGTSAFSEPAWRGSFYPERLPPGQMLAYYARHFDVVEVNSTHYRMPTPDLLAGWAAEVPPGFRFVIKAPRRIGLDTGGPLARLLQVLPALGGHRAPVLFQLPSFRRADPAALEAFLRALPSGLHAAFDFHHPSWQADPEIDCMLAAAGAARVGLDTDEGTVSALPGPDFVYFRLRRSAYATAGIERWAATLRAQQARGLDVYAFLKHEADPGSPARALALREAVAGALV